MEATLNLELREAAGKGGARRLRRAGRVPGVIYGGDGEPVTVSMEAQEALHLFQSISVENTILALKVDGKAPEQALVREIQAHPFRTELIHVDFIRIQQGVLIEVQVPIHLVGTPDGVRNEGGILEHIVHDLPVECVPANIPEYIELDVSSLVIGDALRASDLEMPEGVESLLDPEQTVCAVAPPRVIEEEVAEVVDEELEEGEEAPEGEAEEAGREDSEGED